MIDNASRAIKSVTVSYVTSDGHERTLTLVDAEECPLDVQIDITHGERELPPEGAWRRFESDGTARVELRAVGKFEVSSRKIGKEPQ